jgi:hypothetical protein
VLVAAREVFAEIDTPPGTLPTSRAVDTGGPMEADSEQLMLLERRIPIGNRRV